MPTISKKIYNLIACLCAAFTFILRFINLFTGGTVITVFRTFALLFYGAALGLYLYNAIKDEKVSVDAMLVSLVASTFILF